MSDAEPDARDLAFLRKAIALACEGVAAGQRPFGAVVVDAGGVELAAAFNRSARTGDPFDHAEMAAIRDACAAHPPARLNGGTIYASAEPCSMCAGTILRYGFARVVFGMPEGALSAYMAAFPGILSYPSAGIFALAAGKMTVTGGILPAESRAPFELHERTRRF